MAPVDPMLATAVDEVPPVDAMPGGCVYEPKWDGFRAAVSGDGAGAVAVSSRMGKDLTQSFPDIAIAVATQVAKPVVLDGELVVWGGGRLDFTALQQRLVAGRRLPELVAEQPASYMVFDILAVDGVDLTGRPWKQRRTRLEQLLVGARPPLHLSPATTDRTEALMWFETWAVAGIEGVVPVWSL